MSRSQKEQRRNSSARAYGAPMGRPSLTDAQQAAREAERQRKLNQGNDVQAAMKRNDAAARRRDTPYQGNPSTNDQRPGTMVGRKGSLMETLRGRDALVNEAVRDMEAGNKPGRRRKKGNQ